MACELIIVIIWATQAADSSLIPYHHLRPFAFSGLELDSLGGTNLSCAAASTMGVLLEGKLFLPQFAPEKETRGARDNQQR